MLQNFYENIYRTLNQQPEQVYIRWPKEAEEDVLTDSFTGRDILDSVATYQQLLKEQKIAVGQKVLLALPVGIKLICGILAVMAAGAVPVLPPAGAVPSQLLSLLKRHHIKEVLLQKPLPLGPRLLLKVLGVRQLLLKEPVIGDMSVLQPVKVNGSQAALISHSSGSTGQAKAIYRSHQVLQAQHEVLKNQFPPRLRQRDFPLFPNILLHNLSIGVLSILPALPGFDIRRMDPARLVQQLLQEKVQTLTGNVYYFRTLVNYLEEQSLTLPAVLALGIGGSPVPDHLLQRLHKAFPEADLYVIYGSSEAEPIAVRKYNAVVMYPPQLGYAVGPFCRDIEGCLLPIGKIAEQGYTVGEVLVRGPHVVPADANGWLQTGDYGYVDEHGILFLTGRKGNEKLHGGVQHYQIEHLLLHQEGVENAAARSLAEGFEIFVLGNAEREKLLKVLNGHFPKGIILALHFRNHFPMDGRHHSKILYSDLS
ncbi:hypothetical protein D770_13490 [Flammeovirgaceae bacterium 311]|nr:hypothetical protein D770_13490 [Flammeovirgaceae bacterium 311]